MINEPNHCPARLTRLVGLPCPFCGGESEIIRELNCDTLSVVHLPGCFIAGPAIKRFHWNDPTRIPESPFSDWNDRRPNPKADVAPASGAHVQRVVGCEPSIGETNHGP